MVLVHIFSYLPTIDLVTAIPEVCVQSACSEHPASCRLVHMCGGVQPVMRVLVHIFSYLPTRDLVTAIPEVCRRFKVLVVSTQYWRCRLVHMCGGVQPVRELERVRVWQEACMQRELDLGGSYNVRV